MTCNDCIHYDVCKDDYELGYLFKDENGNYFTDDCQYFKNKADFVEVVRCKDCVHGHWNQETLFGRCVDFCDYTDLRIDKEHYCSYGERRTDNDL